MLTISERRAIVSERRLVAEFQSLAEGHGTGAALREGSMKPLADDHPLVGWEPTKGRESMSSGCALQA